MQNLIKKLLILAVVLIVSVCKGQTNFRDISFQEAVSEANKSDKLLFVDAYTDWCGWCKVMDRETFSKEEVGAFMNKKFISIKVNMEEGFGIDLAMKYRVSSYPHYLIFDQTGQLLAKFGGFLEAEPFKEKVNEVLLPQNQLPPLKNPMDFELGFPEFYRNSFKKRQERSFPSAEELIAYLDTSQDVTDIATWGVVYRFVNDGPYVENIVANKDALIEKYGREDVMAKLSRIVFTEVKAAIKSENEAAFQSALQSADKLLGKDAEDYKLRYRLYYYQMTGQWKEYADLGNSLATENLTENAASLNQIAWTLYENCEANEPLQLAHNWMKDLVKVKREYAYMDTYAAILYKLGKKDEALNAANKAIEIAKETDQDFEGTRELINKIKEP